jgi:hypothetical protein
MKEIFLKQKILQLFQNQTKSKLIIINKKIKIYNFIKMNNYKKAISSDDEKYKYQFSKEPWVLNN